MWLHTWLALAWSLCAFVLCGEASQAPRTLRVTVTAYAPSGCRTASGRWPAVGMLAISRDLEPRLRFGDRVLLLGSVYTIQDRMHARWRRRVDIFVPSSQAARRFGIQHGVELLILFPVYNDTLL
jgi:3D (Asp-Asp-Asp) domain-containing protein